MPGDKLSRKLAVILHADVVGSTSLVHKDEQLAHQRIQEAFKRFADTITRFHGQVRELRGDALLAEFQRASDATSASLYFQSENVKTNASLDDDIQPRLRIGISLGEVVIADGTVTGAGVVLAQRLEQLADADGLCISAAVREALPASLPFEFTTLGEQTVKGFDDSVRVFAVKTAPGTEIPAPESVARDDHSANRKKLVTLVAVLLVLAGVFIAWLIPSESEIESTDPAGMAFELPDKPSIAVLPFDDLSAELPQRSLADGMTETLISTLGQVDDLFVIARNSVMSYRGQAVDVREVGSRLGVGYVLEGSVQQSADKVRVTAQLIDAATGGHLWSERYDRALEDIFHLQDEIALKVLVSLQVQLTDGEVARLRSSTTKNVEAYLVYQKGVDVFFTFTKEAMVETRRLMEQALALDPDFASAIILIAWTHVTDAEYAYSNSRDGSIRLALEQLSRLESRGLDTTALSRGEALMLRGYLGMLENDIDRAIEYGEQSIGLLPNHPDMTAILGLFHHYGGNQQDAINVFRRVKRIDPNYQPWVARTLSAAYFLSDDIEAAEAAARDALERAESAGETTRAFAHQQMAIVFTRRGDIDSGKAEIRRARELAPWLSIKANEDSTFFKNPEDLKRFTDVLRSLGLPEG